jgi:hypothetical protein
MYEREHAAADRLKPHVANPRGKWGLFHEDGLVEVFTDPEEAFREGMRLFDFRDFRVISLWSIAMPRPFAVPLPHAPEEALSA